MLLQTEQTQIIIRVMALDLRTKNGFQVISPTMALGGGIYHRLCHTDTFLVIFKDGVTFYLHNNLKSCTVNSEILGRVLFSQYFLYAKFWENKILTNWRNHSVVY